MLAALTTLLAQVDVREAGTGATTCEGKNEAFCPGFVIDNVDDYVSPVLEHLVLFALGRLLGEALADRLLEFVLDAGDARLEFGQARFQLRLAGFDRDHDGPPARILSGLTPHVQPEPRKA